MTRSTGLADVTAPTPARPRPVPVPMHVQRCGGVQCPPGTCDHDDEPVLHRYARDALPAGSQRAVPTISDSDGESLEPTVAARMSARFGHDFGSVRIHTGAAASESAFALRASAYTIGRHVVMGEGQYRPGTPAGERLLAHELVHTMQQVGPLPSGPWRVSPPSDPAEREAESMAGAVAPA